MTIGDRFKKFDLEKLRTYEKYDNEDCLKPSAQSVIPAVAKEINDSQIEKIKNEVIEKIESIPIWFEYDEDKKKELIENFFETKLRLEYKLENITDKETKVLLEKIYAQISGFGILQTFIEQTNVDSIVVNGTKSIMIQIGGKILDTEIALSSRQLNLLIKNIMATAHNSLESPISCTKMNNCIVTVINENISGGGVVITLRKIQKILGLNDLVLSRFMPKEISEFVMTLINSKERLIISGDIISGKTTLIDNILNSCLSNHKVAIIEDFSQIESDYPRHIKLSLQNINDEVIFERLIGIILGMVPDYVVLDTKNLKQTVMFSDNLTNRTPAIITISSSSPESALNKFISAYSVNAQISEKAAKQKILNEFDYIIHLSKDNLGNCRIHSIHEINITKNSAQVLKELYNVDTNTSVNKGTEIFEDKPATLKSRFKLD